MTDSGTVRSVDGTLIAYERSGVGPALILVDAAGQYRAFGPARDLAIELSTHFWVIV